MNGLEALEEISGCKEVATLAGYIKQPIKKVYKKEFAVIKKELKALEIVKNKKVDFDSFIFFAKGSLNDEWALLSYNEWVTDNKTNMRKKALTKDEFNLLKGVLK